MFDLPKSICDIQTFYAAGIPNVLGSGDQWYTWVKPRGCKMTYIWSLGAGSGGGGGCSGASGTTRGGGGGGGLQGFLHILIPTYLLPDRLYVRVCSGGAGGGPDTAGLDGEANIVAVAPMTTATANMYLLSGNSTSRGSPGTSSARGAAIGNSPGVASSTLASVGLYVAYSGSTFTTGGAHTGAVGTSFAQLTNINCLQGRGGAGVGTNDVAFNGGGATALGLMPALAGGVAPGGHGQNGLIYWKPMLMICGGTGGASHGTGTGGNGGDGALGCGGGGGGAGVTGGSGGRGGDGLVIIASW